MKFLRPSFDLICFMLSFLGMNGGNAFASVSPATQLPEIKVDICKDTHAVTLEMIELELSGRRWQGGESPCLKQSKFKTLYAFKSGAGDSYLTKPEFILSAGREVKIVSEKLGPNDSIEVRIAYIGKKDGKDVAVEDEFSYVVNFGKNRVARGCGSILSDFNHFVMRANCLK